MRIIRAGEHIQHIPGYGISVRESGVAVAAANWWEVPGKTCVAAYQPKGAASYVASKVNLANPGTYDLTEEVGAPAWGAASGWSFLRAETKALVVAGLTLNIGWSHFVRIANSSGVWVCGILWVAATHYGIRSHSAAYMNGGTLTVGGNVTAGVLGCAGTRAYKDGVDVGTIPAATGPHGQTYDYGHCRRLGPYDIVGYTGDIYAGCIYSDTLSGTEAAALMTRMAAL